jgi:DNA-binding response OmpR family regulator
MEYASDFQPLPGAAGGAVSVTMPDDVEWGDDPVETYRARILVVDDERAIAELFEDYLRIQGFDVVTASSGMEALTRLEGDHPDVIILDVRMPEMDGIETLKRIVARNPAVGVLMVSGNDDVILAKEAIALGAFDYILKPIDFGYLDRALEKMTRMDAPVGPVGGTAIVTNSDSGPMSPYDLALAVCRVTRAMSPPARRSVGLGIERIALRMVLQGWGGDRRRVMRNLNKMRTLLRFAKDIGDITDDAHRQAESCLVRVRRTLGAP